MEGVASLPLYLTICYIWNKPDVNGFCDAITIFKDGINKAINNGVDELKLIKNTKEIALQFLIVSLL